jgi:hypothetical protein
LSGFPVIVHGNPDNNLETACIFQYCTEINVEMMDRIKTLGKQYNLNMTEGDIWNDIEQDGLVRYWKRSIKKEKFDKIKKDILLEEIRNLSINS